MTDTKKDSRSAYTNEFEIKLPYLTQLLDVCQEIKEETRIRMKEAMGSEKLSFDDQKARTFHNKFRTAICKLRALNREACIERHTDKTAIQEAKQAMDKIHLQLQSHRHEQSHLRKRIRECRNFMTLYEDLEVVQEGDLPEKVVENIKLKASDEAGLRHQKMLSRLNFEKQERLRLEEERNNKLKRKQELIEKLEAKKTRMQQADKEIKRRFRDIKSLKKLTEAQ
ncbi:5359_t:CDS:2 [Paraglomus occultum]|uniref:5359_t:CDS:1 n=1 Tax=Paraglomus occultum TaxID=144539 RepID=A0A9N9BRZ1_9GLOM|nr:5359_t:CDS:2 [Paraglomus occultum]